MAKTSTERSRERREKLKVKSLLTGGDLVPPSVSEASRMDRLEALMKALDKRVVVLEDRSEQPGVAMSQAGPTGSPVSAPSPARGVPMNPVIQRAMDQVRRIESGGFGGSVVVDPSQMSHTQRVEWVRRNGPLPTAYGELEAS